MVGRGWEHKVMLPKNEILRQNWVLKKPHLLTVLILRITGGVDQLQKEYQEAQILITQTNIVNLPESRIFDVLILGFKKSGYIIAQRRLQEDHGIAAIKKTLESAGQDLLADIFDVQPENFVSQGGIIYWVDPSHAYHRLLNYIFGIPFTKSAKMQALLVRSWRKIMGVMRGYALKFGGPILVVFLLIGASLLPNSLRLPETEGNALPSGPGLLMNPL